MRDLQVYDDGSFVLLTKVLMFILGAEVSSSDVFTMHLIDRSAKLRFRVREDFVCKVNCSWMFTV
ncbi:hypothetical protein L1049_023425 [Liquidambar formosana]|uniref:Uncharacterized protein n=1 Tax=Liquidambar formosana TaxID=63359 RepID=A0AAP0RTB3_LIQFO